MKVTRSTRRALFVVGVAAILLAGTLSAIALWQRHQRQRLTAVIARLDAAITALERERSQPSPVREEDNAASALLAAARGIPASCRNDYPKDMYGLLDRPVGTWTAAERAATPPPACTASLEALRTAGARPGVAFPLVLTEDLDRLPGRSALTALLSAARLLAIDARTAAETGQDDRLAANWRALVKIGTGLAREDSGVVVIIATRVEELELRLARPLVESRLVPTELVAEQRRHLQARAAYGDALSRSLAAEVRMFLEAGVPQPRDPWEIGRLASGLECSYERLLPHLEAPWTEIERAIDVPPARCVDNGFAELVLSNYRVFYERSRAADAARQLAIVALTIHERGAPAAAERVLEGIPLADVPNRYTGERVEVETANRNTLLLRYPEAEERARASQEASPGGPLPPFVYRLTRRES